MSRYDCVSYRRFRNVQIAVLYTTLDSLVRVYLKSLNQFSITPRFFIFLPIHILFTSVLMGFGEMEPMRVGPWK